jgi:hypothetical protein
MAGVRCLYQFDPEEPKYICGPGCLKNVVMQSAERLIPSMWLSE